MTNTAPHSDSTGGLTREGLIVQWQDARRRREAAELGSDAYRAALEDIARIEIEIARVERAMDPPRA